MKSIQPALGALCVFAAVCGCQSKQDAPASTAPAQQPATSGEATATAKVSQATTSPPAKAPKAAMAPATDPPTPANQKVIATRTVALNDEPVAKTAERRGPAVSETPFSAYLAATTPAKVGQRLKVQVVLEAKPPYHCNAEYPHKFKLSPAPAALGYDSEVVRGMQVTEQRGVLELPVQAKSAGPATVAGKLSFSVCTEERCLVEKRDLSVDVEIVN